MEQNWAFHATLRTHLRLHSFINLPIIFISFLITCLMFYKGLSLVFLFWFIIMTSHLLTGTLTGGYLWHMTHGLDKKNVHI